MTNINEIISEMSLEELTLEKGNIPSGSWGILFQKSRETTNFIDTKEMGTLPKESNLKEISDFLSGSHYSVVKTTDTGYEHYNG